MFPPRKIVELALEAESKMALIRETAVSAEPKATFRF
jgi:hypothetical protein